MEFTLAYIDEPPFGWTDPDGSAAGADLELASVVLRELGYTRVKHRLVTFADLLPGVSAGHWNMNVPIFITPERSATVDFSTPVWALGDGFIVAPGNPKHLHSYADVARMNVTLGVMPDTVQLSAALASGVPDSSIRRFGAQSKAIEALLAGEIDAYAGTGLGNRVTVERIGSDRITAVAHALEGTPPLGGFSFAKDNVALRDAFNEALLRYLGSTDHRHRMGKYGFTNDEIDPVLRTK
jgi:polar amino acid transport system substrate-binding protein